MTDKGFLYLPISKILLCIDNISYIRVVTPRAIKLDFPELISKEKRNKETKWKCIIYSGAEELHISGEEALQFLNYISPKIKELKVEVKEVKGTKK